MIFCTNEHNIVQRALYAYRECPTIVNNVPMEVSSYGNTPNDYARADILIASGNRVIGESSNLAQLALSYSYTLDDQKYKDLVCILSVVAQLCIDSSKKRVVIDLPKETKYLKSQLEIDVMGVPIFWKGIKDNVKHDDINYEIECPMNKLYEIRIAEAPHEEIIPISKFFIKHELRQDRRTSKKVEKLIEDYSNDLFVERIVDENESNLVLRDDFEELVERIRTTYIGKGYAGIISWLLDRAFHVSTEARKHTWHIKSLTQTNRALLLKTLYEVSPQSFLLCFNSCRC